jgi:hypothetical protein
MYCTNFHNIFRYSGQSCWSPDFLNLFQSPNAFIPFTLCHLYTTKKMCDRLSPYAATFVVNGFDKILSFARGVSDVHCMVLYVNNLISIPRFDLQTTSKQLPNHGLFSITMICLNKRCAYRCIFLNFYVFLKTVHPLSLPSLCLVLLRSI